MQLVPATYETPDTDLVTPRLRDSVARFEDHPSPFRVEVLGCGDPGCDCRSLLLRLVEEDEHGQLVLGGLELAAWVDERSGEPSSDKATRLHPLMAEFLEDLPLELLAFEADRRDLDRRAFNRLDTLLLDAREVHEGTLQSWTWLTTGAKNITDGGKLMSWRLEQGGRAFAADALYCANPDCDCGVVRLAYSELVQREEGIVDVYPAALFAVPVDGSKPTIKSRERLSREEARQLLRAWQTEHAPPREELTRNYEMVRRIGRYTLLFDDIRGPSEDARAEAVQALLLHPEESTAYLLALLDEVAHDPDEYAVFHGPDLAVPFAVALLADLRCVEAHERLLALARLEEDLFEEVLGVFLTDGYDAALLATSDGDFEGIRGLLRDRGVSGHLRAQAANALVTGVFLDQEDRDEVLALLAGLLDAEEAQWPSFYWSGLGNAMLHLRPVEYREQLLAVLDAGLIDPLAFDEAELSDLETGSVEDQLPPPCLEPYEGRNLHDWIDVTLPAVLEEVARALAQGLQDSDEDPDVDLPGLLNRLVLSSQDTNGELDRSHDDELDAPLDEPVPMNRAERRAARREQRTGTRAQQPGAKRARKKRTKGRKKKRR